MIDSKMSFVTIYIQIVGTDLRESAHHLAIKKIE